MDGPHPYPSLLKHTNLATMRFLSVLHYHYISRSSEAGLLSKGEPLYRVYLLYSLQTLDRRQATHRQSSATPSLWSPCESRALNRLSTCTTLTHVRATDRRTGSVQLTDQGQRGRRQLNQTFNTQTSVCSLPAAASPRPLFVETVREDSHVPGRGTLVMMMMMMVYFIICDE